MTGSGGAWWRHAVIYQVSPRNFADSDGDGIDAERQRDDPGSMLNLYRPALRRRRETPAPETAR